MGRTQRYFCLQDPYSNQALPSPLYRQAYRVPRRLTSKYCIVPAFSIDFSLTVQSAVRKYRSTGCTVYHSTCTSTVPVPVHPGTDVHFCTGVLMNLLVFSTDRVVSTNTNYHSYLCTEYCPILISICSNTPILISICPVLEFRLIGSQV